MPDQLRLRRKVRRLLSQAERAVETRRPRAALPRFDAALAADPLCAYGLFFRAGTRLALGEAAGAEADLRAMEAMPAASFAAYREFEVPSPRLYPGVAKRLEGLLARRPLPFGLALKSFQLRAQGRFDEAVQVMERAADSAPRNAGLRAVLARVRFVNRFPEQGLRDMRRAAALDPRCGWIIAWEAEALRQRGKFAEALRRADLAIKLDPSYFRSYGWRGGALRRLGRPREAVAALDRAVALDREESRGWDYSAAGRDADRNLSWFYNERMLAKRALGDLAGALADLSLAHGRNNRYVWSFSREGGAAAPALAELDAYLKKRPKSAWAWAWRGLTELESGGAERALSDLNRAIALGARSAWTMTWRGRARAALGDAAGALADFDRAVRLDRAYAPAAAWRGGLLRGAGRRKEALRELDRAIALDPVCAWGLAWRGELHLAAGRPERALADLDAALGLDPENVGAYFWRGKAHAALGDWRSASKDVAAVHARRPDIRRQTEAAA
ncbi:MAG: tetratricopeptide repeat protein [Elusimicrobiota bacterium]|nr:tetratricopeptide repeat protein [Elusimicrobiota bacterium]